MVTHNPELAESYSSRIIKILDGVITEDSNPILDNDDQDKVDTSNIGRTSMSFFTAFRLSLNNLLTKKGRTILVAFAGSIGIIGIALIQAVSNGFQAYVDHIQEDTLTSYPLTIMQETTDLTSILLAMTTESEYDKDLDEVKEEQYISNVLDSLSTNDLTSFKKHIEENAEEIEEDVSSIQYSYSVEPMIYTIDATNEITKLNPRNLLGSSMGGSAMMMSFSSVYSQMIDDIEMLDTSYDVLAGRWPKKYNEMIIVLAEPNSISDLLVYSLGLRDADELSNLMQKIIAGETVNISNEPMTFTYEDLMNIEMKLIMQADTYKYNSKYDIYEDMTEDAAYLNDLYNNGIELKIVGVVAPKEGTSAMSLNPGVSYTSGLIEYIIDYASKTDIVKKQIENEEVDVLSGSRFDANKNELKLDFADLVDVDGKKLESAFNVKIDQNDLQKKTEEYMTDISNSVTTNTAPAKKEFMNGLNTLIDGMFNSIDGTVSLNDMDKVIGDYLGKEEPTKIISNLEANYVVPKDIFKTTFTGLLKGILQVYINAFYGINPSLTTDPSNPTAVIYKDMITPIIETYINNTAIQETANTMAQAMTEAVMKKTILTKVGELTGHLTSSFASAFNVDEGKIAGAFKLKITEEEITRIVTAMMSKTETNAKTNLIALGYKDLDDPTYISFYFKSFDGKERFMDFIDRYNEDVIDSGEEDKKINYTDTTGILMGSVKTIVNAVTYVLIAFVSISLVVSSIMIGIITYISVYERTKEIGILRAIGASKKNISSIFNAETFIIGLLSGLFGIGVTYGLIPIINSILHNFTGNIPLNATFYLSNASILIVLSIILTLIGGTIPAKAASKRDPVIALRTE